MGYCLDDGLVLGLGFTSTTTTPNPETHKPKINTSSSSSAKPSLISSFEPSLSLGLSADANARKKFEPAPEAAKRGPCQEEYQSFGGGGGGGHGDLLYHHRPASPHSAVSSFSSGRVKRERDVISGEEMDGERVSSRASDEEEDGTNARKKLRLTKEQSALLEESFKQHSTLNPKQKQALARQLNLRPRQVEVWFQNRRARTKLKQTEVDCELLKKCCETLTDENRRLQKELQELKALKLAQPFYMHMPAATLTMCPSCERIGGHAGAVVVGGDAAPKTPFSIASKPLFYNPFTNPSAAC